MTRKGIGTITINSTPNAGIARSAALTEGSISVAATIIGGVANRTHLGHALAQRRLTIIISSTSDTAAFIAVHETNRRIPTTAGIIGCVTTHADLIDALTICAAAITVVLAGHAAVVTNTSRTHGRRSIAARIIYRVTHRTLAGDTLAIGSRAIVITTARHTLELAIVLDTKLCPIAAGIAAQLAANAGSSITDGCIDIDTIAIVSTVNTHKPIPLIDTIGRICRTARTVDGITELTGVVHTLLGAIAVIVTATRRTAPAIGIGETPRRISTTPGIVGVITNHARLGHALIAVTISVPSTAHTAMIRPVNDTDRGPQFAPSSIGGVAELTETRHALAINTCAIIIASTGQALRLSISLQAKWRILATPAVITHITG